MCTRAEQPSNFNVDSKVQIPHCERKKLQINNQGRLESDWIRITDISMKSRLIQYIYR